MTDYTDRRTIMAGSQLVMGLLLFIMPWIAGFAAEQTAAWTAWATGLLIAVAGIVGLAGQVQPAAWANLVLGLWAVIAPWLLGFAALASAMWSHVVLGLLVALVAAVELWWEQQAPPRVHA